MRKSIAVVKLSSEQLILIAIISIATSIHVIWLILDRSVPTWDDAAHFTNALNYQRVISHIQVFSPDWWHELWAQSPSYTAPFIYLLTVPFLNIFGQSVDSGILVNILFIIITVLTTYFLSSTAFSTQVSLWASGLCLMFPALLNIQTMYMLDYGIVAISCLTFLALTHWKDADTRLKSWQWSLIFGVTFGCLMLSKPTGFLFMLFPIIFLIGSFIKHRNWWGIFQFGVALIIAWTIFGGWFSQNWLTVITSAIGANGMGKIEGDPGGDTLAGWFYYLKMLPELISLPILVVTIGLMILWVFKNQSSNILVRNRHSFWLILYCLGGYFFCSLAINKDSRFILPILPVLSIFFAYGLNLFQTTWARRLKWGAIGVTGLILLINLFAIPGINSLSKVPYIHYGLIHRADIGSKFPHQEIISEITHDRPYLKSTIGVLSASPEFNAENLDSYGHLADFQVYARYLVESSTEKQQFIDRGLKALNWYAIQIGNASHNIIEKVPLSIVEQNPDLQLHKTWTMPDASTVRLYRRKNTSISVEPILDKIEKVKLEKVIISPSSRLAVNTSYQVSGDRELLQNGLLILTWQSKDKTWHHDRSIGLGNLYLDRTSNSNFRVTEKSSMFPSGQLPLDTYQLTATYLNRRTGKTFPLAVPKIEIKSLPENLHEPDSIVKLTQLNKLFARGKIDPVFSEVNTLNQYDPTQDYLAQARQAIEYRIKQGESQVELKYTLALIQALQRRIEPLLDNLTKITQTDPQNLYAWTYLGFIRLYNWQPQAAEIAFQVASKLPSPPPELATLKVVSSIFRFNLLEAWQRSKI
ncbi:glycosyltransferase family 39 protein [Chamaesiphon sp. VAR_48_metabat_135_sub]|uniref:glycosyltransferase family 39 protein n=1 Tax=Chamaesiphon sp. VAR_48_metabat_135_sub TaxID=2964699 RepID=UPI00286C4133|nr:glycosyltransferase family 39 protein [Chamaesiphon sp. VAR_48_metabat_135_sub]